MANIVELKKIVQYVKEMEDGGFDIRFYGCDRGCGTVYCALGEYVRREGLIGDVLVKPAWWFQNGTMLDISRKDIEQRLDLTRNETDYLFFYHSYEAMFVTRQEVVDRLEQFIAEKLGEMHIPSRRLTPLLPGPTL